MEAVNEKSPRRIVRSDGKRIIHNVLKFCIEEKKKGLLIPLHKANERAAKAVGKCVRTVINIRKDCEEAERSGKNVTTPRKQRKQ